MIRPLRGDESVAAFDVQWAALSDLGDRTGDPMPTLDDEGRARGALRIAHLQQTDPESAFAAEVDGRLVGCGLALVREGMWFLSLLMVEPGQQARGLGRALLDATLQTATDRSWLLATTDPKALRRYRRAGFDLVPCLLPVTTARQSTWSEHGEYADHVLRRVRGAGMRQDLDYCDRIGSALYVADDGFLVLRRNMIVQLAATRPSVARDLLWTAFAELEGPVTVDWLAHDQQWAIDTCLDAGLPLLPGEGHLFLKGQPLMSPYLPGGALG
jgi:GNAT superfamily N-acetyltransferase